MGACLSRTPKADDEYARAAKVTLGSRELEEMDLLTQGSLRRAFSLFRQADTDRNGKLDSNELARMFKLEDDVYLGRLVDIIDCDGNGTIDFREFVVGLAAFVVSGSFGRVRFAFRLFDLNNDGRFSKFELLSAIRASEQRQEARSEKSRKNAAAYWGDRSTGEPFAKYKDIIQDMDANAPESMTYDDFTRIVTRYPKIFAPVNQVWHALRKYADPAAKVVRQIRESGNLEFFKGTLLEPGRTELIFAPENTTKPARALTPQTRRETRQVSHEVTQSGDANRMGRWLEDARASVRRISSAMSVSPSSSQKKMSRKDVYAWDGDALSPSETLAETRLDEDTKALRASFGPGQPSGKSSLDKHDASGDVTMNEIWEALRGAPDAKAQNAQRPEEYAARLDVAAAAKRRAVAERSGTNAARFKSEADQRRLATGNRAPEWIRGEAPESPKARQSDDKRGRVENDARRTRREGENRHIHEVIAAHKAAKSLVRRPRNANPKSTNTVASEESSATRRFHARVAKHVAAGPPSEVEHLGLR
jgi:Ca2+-binding EF-hand superfamily protein